MKSLVVDSSCWIEVLTNGKQATKVQGLITKAERLIVPTVVIFEVFRKIKTSTTEEKALLATSFLSQHEVQPLTREISLLAADLSIEHKLAMADSLVLAHAKESNSQLLTLDKDFRGLAGTIVI